MSARRVVVAAALTLALGSCGTSADTARPQREPPGEATEGAPTDESLVSESKPPTGVPTEDQAGGADAPRRADDPPVNRPVSGPPRQGEYRYRVSHDKEHAYLVESVSADRDGWRVQINDSGKVETQSWTSRGITLVSEKRGGATCEFDPPLLLRPKLSVGVQWTAESECRLGDSDTYMSRTIRARVITQTTVSVTGTARRGWRIEESIRTVIAGRPPSGMSVVTTQPHESVDERTQNSVFSDELGVALIVEGHSRFTNPDRSVHEGDFRYELIDIP